MFDNKISAENLKKPPAKNYPRLQILGHELITKFGLDESRRQFRFDTGVFQAVDGSTGIIQTSSDLEISAFVNAKLQELGILGKSQNPAAEIEIIRRESAANVRKTGLGWHIDDCQLVSKNTPPTYSPERFIHLFDDRWLYISCARSRIPRWTMILYLSTEGPTNDFIGGRLRLADGTEYRPVAGLGLLIDSREVHMVSPVRQGLRKSIVVKIY